MTPICRYCHSKDTILVNHIEQHDLYRCKLCTLLQTEVDNGQIRRVNINKYNALYLDNYVNLRGKQLIRSYQNNIFDIERLKFGGRILDIGCGPCLFLDTLNKFSIYKWSLFGIDINKNSLKRINKTVHKKLINTSINNNNFVNHYFDVVTCFDVLEHSTDINKSLLEIKRILKDDGLLVIQVPNSASLMRILTGKDWDWWCVPDHIFHFSSFSIKKILIHEGFKIVKTSTYDTKDIFIQNIQGHIRKILPYKFKFNRIVAKLSYFFLFLLWLFSNKIIKNYKYGGLTYLLAQKQ